MGHVFVFEPINESKEAFMINFERTNGIQPLLNKQRCKKDVGAFYNTGTRFKDLCENNQ